MIGRGVRPLDDEQPRHAPEADLQRRAAAGDRVAAAELLGRSRTDAFRFCYRYLGSVQEAEDAAHDVLIRLWGAEWPTGSLRAYLFRLARNHCLNLLKRRRRSGRGDDSFLGDPAVVSPRTGPRTAAARDEEHERLRAHLDSLSRPHAEVLMLRYFENLSRKEMAEVLELPESVVKSRLHEARKELHRRIGDRE